jgi:hypothetical protein
MNSVNKIETISRQISGHKRIRKVLTVFIAFVLLCFTLNSCKWCSKNKDNSAADPSIPGINEIDLSEVERYLKGEGASHEEIEATKHIATEDFGSDVTDINHIGYIVYANYHYYYRDHNKRPHDGQPAGTQNCGLYALKRLLFVLGKHPDTKVDKNLWYKHTDVGLREMMVRNMVYPEDVEEAKSVRDQNTTIGTNFLKTLMRDVGVPIDRCEIYTENGEGLGVNIRFFAPLLTKEEKDAFWKAAQADAAQVKADAEQAVRDAQAQVAVAEKAKREAEVVEAEAVNQVNNKNLEAAKQAVILARNKQADAKRAEDAANAAQAQAEAVVDRANQAELAARDANFMRIRRVEDRERRLREDTRRNAAQAENAACAHQKAVWVAAEGAEAAARRAGQALMNAISVAQQAVTDRFSNEIKVATNDADREALRKAARAEFDGLNKLLQFE